MESSNSSQRNVQEVVVGKKQEMQQNPLYKHVGTEIRGCNGKVTVGQLPERLGRIIRPLLYQLCEEHTQWPLSFNEKTDELRLKTGQEELRKSLDGMWKDIYVSYGKCVPDKNGVSVMTPKILKRITKVLPRLSFF